MHCSWIQNTFVYRILSKGNLYIRLEIDIMWPGSTVVICWQLKAGKQNMMLDVGWYWNTWCFIYSDVNSGKTKRQKLMQNYFYLKVPSLHITNCVVKRESVFSACIPCQKIRFLEANLKTGYLKRSQCCELAILRPFLAIFPQTTWRTFTKVKLWWTFWGAKHV